MITLTKKSNGRYYLGMPAEDFRWLKETIRLVNASPLLRDATPEEIAEKEAIARIAAAMNKPARGE
ncbi:MAG: hypothetical protein IPK82_23440 [Polyangiaceae bacterium]|nr:hypothetical protein [Polyangiaceae bacterium]